MIGPFVHYLMGKVFPRQPQPQPQARIPASSATNRQAANYKIPGSSDRDPRFSGYRIPASSMTDQRVANYLGPQQPATTTRVLGASIAPSTGGQGFGGGGPSAPTSGGGGFELIPPQSSYTGPSEDDVIDQLRGVYGQARSDIEAQLPILEQGYNLAKGDIEGAITDAQKKATAQKQDLEVTFGDVLRNQLKTKQELDRQRQGTFSGLGTLDSSSFQEQQFRGDQAFQEQRSRTDTERAKSLKSVDDAVASYTRQAQGELARLALQYQQGRNALASALAQNNLQQAGAIQSAIDQLRQRAQDVQNTVLTFANQATLLKAQGLNVRTQVGGITGQDYAAQVAQLLAQMSNAANAQYVIPRSATPQGPGYIGPGNRRREELPGLANV